MAENKSPKKPAGKKPAKKEEVAVDPITLLDPIIQELTTQIGAVVTDIREYDLDFKGPELPPVPSLVSEKIGYAEMLVDEMHYLKQTKRQLISNGATAAFRIGVLSKISGVFGV